MSKLPCPGTRDLILSDVRSRRFGSARPACLYCAHKGCQRWGSQNGRQRYRCSACRRSFSDLTATPLAHCRRLDRWPPVLGCMAMGCTVRETASVAGIHPSTAFRWRHRALQVRCISETLQVRSPVWRRTWFLQTPIRTYLSARRRRWSGRAENDPLALILLRRVRPRSRARLFLVLEPDLDAVLFPPIPSVCRKEMKTPLRVLTGHRGLRSPMAAWCRREGVIYRSESIHRSPELERLRAEGSRLRRWMGRFRGVSEKNLKRYLVWYGAVHWSGRRPGAESTLWRGMARDREGPTHPANRCGG
jgi:transposase-like protein